jgi:hypothetical protein
MVAQIDFSPLATYSKAFLFFRLIHRIRMIVTRLLFVLLVISVLYGIWYVTNVIMPAYEEVVRSQDTSSTTTTGSYSYSSSDSGWNFLMLFFIPYISPVFVLVVTMYLMSARWHKFADRNGFTVTIDIAEMQDTIRVPSFRGKLLQTSLAPIIGTIDGRKFAFFTRQYKEGGLLRWRERKMDTVFIWFLPARLPHVIINARANETARRSNMTISQPAANKFQFEGTWGEKYDVYADPADRVVTLQLFTPDVLSVLYDKLPTADIELQGDRIWVIQRYGILHDKLAATMFDAANLLRIKLEKQLTSARIMQQN